MLTLEQVTELAGSMIENDVTTLEVSGRNYALRLVRAPGTGPARVDGPARVRCVSPATGVFHPRGGDDGLPELAPGAEVVPGEPLGYVGIGPVRVVCAAPAPGRICSPLPSQGQAIRTGDALFTVDAMT